MSLLLTERNVCNGGDTVSAAVRVERLRRRRHREGQLRLGESAAVRVERLWRRRHREGQLRLGEYAAAARVKRLKRRRQRYRCR